MRNFDNIENDNKSKKPGKKRMFIGLFVVIIIVAALIGTVYYLDLFNGGGAPDVSVPVTLDPDDTQTLIATQTDEQGNIIEPIEPIELTRRDGVYTFLAFGVDESGAHTDVIMLVCYDTVNGTLDVLNIPRDTYSVANSRSNGLKHINLAFSGGGTEQLRKEVMNLVGYNVDWYVKIDMDGFVKVINYIGGVEFDVPQDMKYDDDSQDLHINLKKGLQTLDVGKALQLVRYRSYFNADIGRIDVRSDFLKALGEQLLTTQNVSKAAELAGTIFDNAKTDISKNDLVWCAKKAVDLDAANINFYTVPGGPATDSGMWIPYHDALLKIINEHLNPFTVDIENINIVERSENAGK